MRAQTELPAVAIALVLLTSVFVLSLGAADSALSSADRPALERQAAVSLSEALTAPGAHVTRRASVLDNRTVANLSVEDLETRYGASPDTDVRIRLGGETLIESGDPTGGTSITRLVVVERRTRNRLVPTFADNRTVTLPQRATAPVVDIDPPRQTTVRRVYADEQILLENRSGIEGVNKLSLSRFETEQLRFEAIGPLPKGSVEITHDRIETEKTTLEVTVDA
ncbi:hypothetical protein GRX03_03710 [Halovenus sp. WSH3]|uniref:Uncharacterized protein n=1 Tax=Halovenus carboxidivorans TaxID=2692199 RepID=A0A6B0SYQ3_9EURY|nr:hypothetical protein [Halovenus carboxidivorans]MXR50714.1 hypothetical protein [Halovenus carboxidivorans]